MERLDEIREREAKASAEIGRLTAGNPGDFWRWSIPADEETDSDLILSASLADIAALTSAVQAVLNKHRRVTEGSDEPYCRECFQAPYGHAPFPCPTVTVITAALDTP